MSDIPEIPPTPEIPPVPTLAETDRTESGLAPNIAAALAEFFSIVGGLVFYFIEKKNIFVRFHALQSIYLGAAFLAFTIAVSIVCAIPFIGFLFAIFAIFVLPIAGISYTVLILIATFQAFNRREWEIPWIGKLAHKHLAEGLFFFVKSPVI